LIRFAPDDIPRLHEVGFNWSILGFAFAISILTGVIFGLVPALQASRPDMSVNLKEGSQSAGASNHRFRGALVVVEFALSLALMAGAGLLARSFWRLLQVSPGFDPRNVVMARIWLPVPNHPELDQYRPPEKRNAFMKDVLRRASALPGAQYAAIGSGNGVPLIGPPRDSAAFTIEARADADSNPPRAQVTSVSPDYFRVLGAPLVRGRFFDDRDDRQAPLVVLVDEAMASRYWPNEDPVGRRIKFGARASNSPWMTIAGVVGNIKTDGLDQPDQPHIYAPIFQNSGYAMAVYIRADADAAGAAGLAGLNGLTQALRREIRAVDPDLPVFGERKMEDLISASLAQRRFAARLISLFGALALLLSGIGIYGVIAWSVSQRTREIGIRLALGADTGAILRWILWHGMRLTLIGVTAGLLGAAVMTRLLRGLLFEVTPADPLTYICVAALLSAVALLACYIPARRATKVDPMIALRYE
jgi:putative ABC transport system permease protein